MGKWLSAPRPAHAVRCAFSFGDPMEYVNYCWKVQVAGENIIEISQCGEDDDWESVIIDISQHAALVRAIGLCADEIYRRRREQTGK